jgi:hypothetical protein
LRAGGVERSCCHRRLGVNFLFHAAGT